MPHTTRRRLFRIGFGALAAGVPVESRPNDAELRRLADEWLALGHDDVGSKRSGI